MSQPKITVTRCGLLHWSWDVWWDDGDDTGHGIGGWSRTRHGGLRAARREARR